jgi:iron complex outermembrane receptor protein
MHRQRLLYTLTPLACACTALALMPGPAHAQDASGTQRITVIGSSAATSPSVAGFGDATPLARTPLAAAVIGDDQRRDAGLQRIADLTRADASLADSYNAEGYWSFLSIRGFTLDNRANYLRDGLPINAETALPLDNKSQIEILKGTSGIQAGTSAPGGLVNLVVKRPERAVRSATLEARQGGSTLAAVDLGDRLGDGGRIGVRLNVAAERLDPSTRDAQGRRHMFAVAVDARLDGGLLIEAEVESTHQSQPSVPGFSVLGTVVPDARAIDPRTNLNNQAWSQPVIFDGVTGSIRLTQALGEGWRARLHAMTQHLRTDDRIAFPYGCSAEGRKDRFCSDGTFDLYDFRSDGERRRSDAIEVAVEGRARTGTLKHHLSLGLLSTRVRATFPPQVFNFAGVGRIDGSLQVPAAPLPAFDIEGRNDHGTELFLRDRMELDDALQLWGGLRHSRLERDGVAQSFTAPWLALAWQLDAFTTAYASAGQGVETEVAPRLPLYANAGRALPALTSRQVEAGIKHARDGMETSLAAFSVTRPQSGDFGACDVDASCTRAIDGSAVHRGLEASVAAREGAWRWQASALALHARREGSAIQALNGLAPVNVPSRSLRLDMTRTVGDAFEWRASLAHEGPRAALPDHSAMLPSWTRLDLGAKLEQRRGDMRVVWRAAIDNVADRRAWKEAPFQFGHAYLFPLAPRSLRLSVQIEG